MIGTLRTAAVLITLASASTGFSQTAAPAQPAPVTAQTKAVPLRLESLAPSTQADPFPAVDPKNFTADTPTAATVDSYLKAVLGYDANRIWRVVAIQKTAAPGVSKVTALVSERAPNAKVLNASFYVLPDGHHLIADGTGVAPFGANPYTDSFALLKAGADGPYHGSASKNLMLVEFADLQCVHCKEVQPIMARLAQDFPQAHIVYQNFPIPELHPFALEAAAYGACVSKTGNDAFFNYAQAVYDTQAALTAADGQKTLDTAVTKAGGDPKAIALCAATPAIKAQIAASTRLGNDLGVFQTPTLAINGRLIPLTSVPYDTLKQVIAFQAAADGVSTAAPTLGNPH